MNILNFFTIAFPNQGSWTLTYNKLKINVDHGFDATSEERLIEHLLDLDPDRDSLEIYSLPEEGGDGCAWHLYRGTK